MLLKKLKQGYGKYPFYNEEEKALYGGRSFNCAEKILRGANEVYGLGLTDADARVAAAFGGGMGIQSVCGAVTGALMALGLECTEDLAKGSDVKERGKELISRVEARLGSIQCSDLKPIHYVDDPAITCDAVTQAVAEVLDEMMAEIRSHHE